MDEPQASFEPELTVLSQPTAQRLAACFPDKVMRLAGLPS